MPACLVIFGAAAEPDVEVLLRVTKAGSVKTEKGFNADVIRYNNTQNIVKLSDFCSNDTIHLGLEKKLAEQRPRGTSIPAHSHFNGT
jgi:hypothetical protein